MKKISLYSGVPALVLFALLAGYPLRGESPETDLAETVLSSSSLDKPNSVYTVDQVVDLAGKTLVLPKGSILQFKSGGMLRNGAVVGDYTSISGSGVLFDRVKLSGTWAVPNISTAMFKDLSYDNSLQDVFALLNDGVDNTLVIEKGDYWVKAEKNAIAPLNVGSNNTIVIDGNIRLRPNDLQRSYALRVIDATNVMISGTGSVVGEKDQHLGEDGEWGMGIYIANSSNVVVDGLSVSNCWGDCITTTSTCSDVIIRNCTLSNARRQGISICGGRNVTVKNCLITDISGTAPEYGIDIEPDGGKAASNIILDGVEVRRCKGGIMTYGGAKDASVSGIQVINCVVDSLSGSKHAYSFEKSSDIIVDNCKAFDNKGIGVHILNSKNVTVRNSNLRSGPRVWWTIYTKNYENVRIEGNMLEGERYAFEYLTDLVLKDNVIKCGNLSNPNYPATGVEIVGNRIDGKIVHRISDSVIRKNEFTDNSFVNTLKTLQRVSSESNILSK